MEISPEVRDQVRQRAKFACEYCGVSEADTGGLLTIDHFRPGTHGGQDQPDNLIYCCYRCNLYKAAYWPLESNDAQLWNPRGGAPTAHWLELDDGRLLPISPVGEFTIKRLRLNRPQLVAHRLRKLAAAMKVKLLKKYLDLTTAINQLEEHHAMLLRERHDLLEQQRNLLKLLLEG